MFDSSRKKRLFSEKRYSYPIKGNQSFPRTSFLPGDLSGQEILSRAIRVNQAGEYGAVRIYEGHMAISQYRNIRSALFSAMLENEKAHLAVFNKLLIQYRIRPTILQPLWHVLGFALGASSAFLGEKVAMICTVAIEEVIEQHYTRQVIILGDMAPELRDTILTCRDEESAHRSVCLEYDIAGHPAFPFLSNLLKVGSQLAIWLSERV